MRQQAVIAWEHRMLRLAVEVASWSRAPEGRRHGCVLAVDGRYVVATGYNGPAAGEGHCECAGKPKQFCLDNCKAVHAEINAVCNAARVGAPIEWCFAFVTKRPCEPCRSALKNAGLRGMVWILASGVQHAQLQCPGDWYSFGQENFD